MSKSREIACRYYEYEGCCSKGKKGTFRKACQNCQSYVPIQGGKPARPNLKHKKMEKIKNADARRQLKEY